MKTLRQAAALFLLLSPLNAQLSTARAQGTAFTYQGRLLSGTNATTGTYDLRFAVFDTLANGTGMQQGNALTNSSTLVSNGLFTVTLDFGNQFPGALRWLEIAVRTNGAGTFLTLTPRQPLNPAPYAVFAASANATNLVGTISSASLPDGLGGSGNTANGVSATVGGGDNNTAGGGEATVGGGGGNTANGGDSTVSGGTGNTAGGNLATVAGGAGNTAAGNFSFAAGHDAQATNDGSFVWADSQFGNFYSISNDSFNVRAQGGVRFVTGGAGMTVDGNFIAGYAGNKIGSGVVNGFVGGGGDAVEGPNVAAGNYSAVLGGVGNTASGEYSTAMGAQSTASGIYSIAGGGTANASAPFSTAMGNFVTASGRSSFAVGGGNTASGGWSAAMGGGTTASGMYSMAAGFYANATNDGAFVWGDTQNAPFSSTNNDSFNVRAQGGARFVTGGTGMSVDGTVSAANFSGNGAGLTNLTASSAQLASIGNGNSGSSANFFLGSAGNSTTTGSYNTANGYQALFLNTTANNNTAEGYQALYHNTTGSANTASGLEALYNNTNGTQNTAYGEGALYSNTSGSGNIALGFFAGQNITTGSSNIDIGNPGVATDTNIIRIGTPGVQTTTLLVGNVGIGTTTPLKVLEVAGSAAAVSSGASIDPSVLLRLDNLTASGNTSSPNVAGIGFGNTSTRQAIVGGTFGNDYLDFYTGGLLTAPKMRIDFNGKVGIGTNAPSQALHVIGNILASGTITGSSDRNVKTNFAVVSPREVLDKVAGLPITRWNYDADLGVAHIGPMAQDFYAAFNVGMDDKHISMVDADGVALAAIQGLNQKLNNELQQKQTEITELKAQNQSLEKRLEAIERFISKSELAQNRVGIP